jgi:hypothetical protein
MRKEMLARYISTEIQFVTEIEREEILKDLMKMKEKSLRLLAEHIEYISDKVEV